MTATGPVRGAVVSVGTELLLGDLTDTNATWISRRLRDEGVRVLAHVAARDVTAELVDALAFAADRAEVVIVGGGLGPTVDDLTREAVAALAGVPLERRPELEGAIEARFAAMGRPMPEVNRRQAAVPAGARAFAPAGTAPAFALDVVRGERTVTVVALPGVPWELHQLWDAHVVAEVRVRTGGGAIVTRIVQVGGRGESDVASVIEPIVAPFVAAGDVELAFLAKQTGIQVRLTASGPDREAAVRRAAPALEAVLAALEGDVVGLDDEDVDRAVVRLLTAAGTTVATAESATAGAIAARLGRVPGASRVLRGGAVVYATDAKRDVLGIDAGLLAAHGPVSAEVTAALATAVRSRFSSDWGIAVTGVAGPDPVGDLPVGTVHWALAHPDGHVEVHGRTLPGDRDAVVARLGSAALDLLRRRLVGG